MTTVRLSSAQKQKLERARSILSARSGRNLSRGDVIEKLAQMALDRPDMLAVRDDEVERTWKGDPLFDPNIGWNMGRTDEKTVDRLLYGRR